MLYKNVDKSKNMLLFQHRYYEKKFHKCFVLKNCTGTIYWSSFFMETDTKESLASE